MRIIDSHCHLQLPHYDADRDEVIRRALSADVGMIFVGTDLETSEKAIELATLYEGVWASVGLHPNDNLDEMYDETEYERLASSGNRVVAIGEIGLDYFRTRDNAQKDIQRNRFHEQLDLAERLGLPVIIHCRDAHADMAKMLHSRTLKGVIHSFTGTKAEAERYVEYGYHIGINGIATFTDQYNDVIRAVPRDRLLVETDSPFLAPVPHRGKRNEPSYIFDTARHIAALRGEPVDTLITLIMSNTCTLFAIGPVDSL